MSLTPEQLQYFQEHADDNKQPSLWATHISCLIIPTIAVFLRLLARYRSRQPLKADDWLIIAALFPTIGMCVSGFIHILNGNGKHIIFVKSPSLFVQIFIAMVTEYNIAMFLAKTSVLFLYRRIFPSPQIKTMSIIVMVIVAGYSLSLFLVSLLQCIPLSTLWTGKPGVCVDIATAYVALAIANVVTDAIILALPIREVLNLKMQAARKAQVLAMFLLGGVVCIFGIIRTISLTDVDQIDTSWSAVGGTIWSQVEISVAIVSANLPTFRPLFVSSAALLGSTFNSSAQQQSGYSSNNSGSHQYNGGKISRPKVPTTGWSQISGKWSSKNGADGGDSIDKEPFVMVQETSHGNSDRGTEMGDIRVDTRLQQSYSHV